MRFDLEGVISSNTGVEDNEEIKDVLFRENRSVMFMECWEMDFPVVKLYLLF